MQRRSKILALVFGFASALSGPASAADYNPPVLPVQGSASGWYLRGDIGLRVDNKIDEMILLGPLPIYDYPLKTNVNLQNIPMLGIGAGYKWNWFRADITTDYAGNMGSKGGLSIANAF